MRSSTTNARRVSQEKENSKSSSNRKKAIPQSSALFKISNQARYNPLRTNALRFIEI